MAPKRDRSKSPTTTSINNTSTTSTSISMNPHSSSPMKLSSSPTTTTTTITTTTSQLNPSSTPPKQSTSSLPITSTSTTPTPSTNRNSPSSHSTSLPNVTPPRTTTSSPSPSSASPTSSSSTSSSSPASKNNNHSSSPTARRVKLYRLSEDQWLDLGTGSCIGSFIESSPLDNQQQQEQEEGAFIIVTREQEVGKPSEIILRSRVQPYPSGYLSDEDEDEDGPGGGGKVGDVGGYQRQQETLIVWTDKETEIEMALSFATTAGCTEIWEFIKAARRWSEQAPDSPSISSPSSPPQPFPLYSVTKLPEPSLGNIDQVEVSIRSIGRTAAGRERTAVAIIKGNYIQKLIRIQEEAEDLESLEDLHAICRVMQTILLLNDNVIFDLILRDEIVLGVASILEYDPEFPTMKASYRAHLADPNQFTQIIPIRSPTLLAKIHQTHRLHYFKDVVLARILEDSTFSMLNSAIYFNEVDIVNEVAGDGNFLKELFDIFDEVDEEIVVPDVGAGGNSAESEEQLIGPMPPSIGPQLPSTTTTLSDKMEIVEGSTITNGTPTSMRTIPPPPPGSPPLDILLQDRKHDAILFLQQFTSMAKNLQLPARSAFFRSLADKGLLRVIEVALSLTLSLSPSNPNPRIMRSATIEILMMLVDHDPNNVRGYSLKQQGAGKRPLVAFLIELFHGEIDLGLKAQMSEALRVLVDAGGNGGPLEAPPRLRPEDPEAEKFLQYFYDHCILPLLAPILALPELTSTDPPLELPPHSVALCAHLCDLLCFFVSHHTFRSKYFVLSTSISTNVAKLFKARHKHLRLAALRYFRACVGKNDDFYNRFLIKNLLLDPILEMSREESERDNLLSSACLEFFEFVRSINAKALINHLMESSGDTIRSLAEKGLVTFANLIIKWEQNNEPPPPDPTKVGGTEGDTSSTATSKGMSRERGNWTRMDTEEEESYFNGSDEEEDSITSSSANSKKREGDHSLEGIGKKPKLDELSTEDLGGSNLVRSQTHGSLMSQSKGLVEYGDEDEEDEEEADGDLGPGGFIREKKSTTTPAITIPDSAELDRHTREAAPPPPSPTTPTNGSTTPTTEASELESSTSIAPEFTPGELLRRKEAEEDDADSMGFLAKGGGGGGALKANTNAFTPAIKKVIMFGGGGAKSLTPAASGSGIKISLGSGFGKLLGVSKEKEKETEVKEKEEEEK